MNRTSFFLRLSGAALAILALSGAAGAERLWAPDPPKANYWVFVANESSDVVSLVRFGPEGGSLEADIPIGIMPTDIDGAHGVRMAPDGAHVYVSVAHGTPFGTLWKIRAADRQPVDTVTLGLFPATIGITPDGALAFVANFNLHGDPVPSSVSAVFLPTMSEVAKIETCVKPHGMRINHAGTFAYSGCLGDDQLVEIDVDEMAVSRRLLVRPGEERTLSGPVPEAQPGDAKCSPTWVVPAHDDRNLYVACNANDEILEIDAGTLEVERRFEAPGKPYNLDVTSDGRLLLSTNKGAQSVSIFDIAEGKRIARIETTQPVTHGVVVSPDDRYAFVSNESIGAVPGTVDVIDLETMERVASIKVRYQAGGIDFWKMEEVSP